MSRRTRILLGWLLTASWATPAAAEVPALQQVAQQLSAKVSSTLQADSHRVPTLAVVVEGDQALMGQEGRIAQELERLLVFHLEAGTAVERAFPLGTGDGRVALERARQAGASWLLRCVIGLKGGELQLTADLGPARLPFWERLADPLPRGSRYHLFVAVKVDREIDLLLGKSRAPPALGSWHLEELLYLPRRILDLGLGDLDGDGTVELVLLYDQAIEVFAIEDGKPQRLTSYSLEQVPENAVRTRDPSGSLLVVDFNRDGRYEIFYHHFNRRWGEVLTFNGVRLQPVRRLKAVPLCLFHRAGRPVVLYGRPQAGTNRYQPEIELADINDSKGQPHSLPGSFVALRCWQSGDATPRIIAVDPAGELVRLDLDFQPRSSLQGVGAGSGVLDLDQDGRPELVLSDPVWPGEPDSLRVVSRDEVIWRSRDVVGGVVAVAGGEANGAGKIAAVLAAVEPGGKASRVYLLGR